MHGLDTPQSDEDIRHITKQSIRDVISPFKNDDLKVQSASGEDVESWELRHFTKHLTQGNATCYEVIKSPLYEKTELSEVIRSLMPLVYDPTKILYAHIGYAEAQLKRYIRPAVSDLMSDHAIWINDIWEYDKVKRIPKCIVAAYRVLAQGKQLLRYGDFQAKVSDYSVPLHDKLMEIKTCGRYDYVLSRAGLTTVEQELEQEIHELKAVYSALDLELMNKKPQLDKIEDILCEIYLGG